MNDVVLDDAVEEMTSDKTKLSVNGSKSALDKGPGASLKVRHVHVRVVKVGNCNYGAC